MELKALTNIPVLMHTLLAQLNSLAADDLARIGVTAQSARALIMLMQHSELRCSMLSRLLGLEATTLSHLLRALSNDQLIVRNRVANDNRAVVVRLTAKGKRVAGACYDLALANERTLMTGLDAKDLQMLARILDQMGANVTPEDRRVAIVSTGSFSRRRP
jgi:MarR family transcriptional regulator, organic hydroperoxide resistance regulator